jgi:anti-sigma B factor antagonist
LRKHALSRSVADWEKKTMQIKKTIEKDAAQLVFSGDILGEADGAAVRSMIYNLAEADVKRVVIDLGDVRHINSAGLGSLVAGLITMRKSGGDIRLARVHDHVQEVLVITRLVQIFDTHESVKEALKAFRNAPGGRPLR